MTCPAVPANTTPHFQGLLTESHQAAMSTGFFAGDCKYVFVFVCVMMIRQCYPATLLPQCNQCSPWAPSP
eukprot:1160010-Pelagomonas_calceolata.AAC.2